MTCGWVSPRPDLIDACLYGQHYHHHHHQGGRERARTKKGHAHPGRGRIWLASPRSKNAGARSTCKATHAFLPCPSTTFLCLCGQHFSSSSQTYKHEVESQKDTHIDNAAAVPLATQCRQRDCEKATHGPLAPPQPASSLSLKQSNSLRGSLTTLPPHRNRPFDSSQYFQRDTHEVCGLMPESEGPGVFVATCLQQPRPPNIKRSILLRSIVLLLLLLRVDWGLVWCCGTAQDGKRNVPPQGQGVVN